MAGLFKFCKIVYNNVINCKKYILERGVPDERTNNDAKGRVGAGSGTLKGWPCLSDLDDLEDDQYLTAHDLQVHGRSNAVIGTFGRTAGVLL